MSAELLAGLLFCLVLPALAIWGIVAYFVARERRRSDARLAAWTRDHERRDAGRGEPRPARAAQTSTETETERIAWLLSELARPEVRTILPNPARLRLIGYFQTRLAPTAVAPDVETPAEPVAEVASLAAATIEPVPSPVQPAVEPEPVVLASAPAVDLEPTSPVVADIASASADARAPLAATSAPAPAPVAAASAAPPLPPPPHVPPVPTPKPWETWDSAVVLLYLGAFLVVAAGLVYSSYNWSDLPGWQKVGMLLGATLGFAGGGFALLRVARVRPAAETFVGIGAFLAPMNVLASYNFLQEGGDGPVLGAFGTLEVGALLVGALYAIFSYRPGGLVYRYATVGAFLVAAFALPPALSSHWAWGAVLTAFATALVPDAPRRLGGRLRRFARPAVDTGLVALPLAVGAALAAALADRQPWAAPAVLAAASLTVGRLAVRRDDDWLAWLWTALAASTAGAALLAGDRPAADWAPAAVALAALWLVLGERGPALLRRAPNREVLHAEALALFAIAPVLAAADERWRLLTLTGAAATAGCAALARLRREPPLLVLAALAATGTYLSLANLVPDRVLDAPLALLLAPGALILAGAGAVVAARIGGRLGRLWARPVWAVAGIDAFAVTFVAYAAAADAGGNATTDALVIAAVSAVFGLVAVGAARSLRLPDALLAAAGWVEIAAVAALTALPAGFDPTLPALVLANLVLVAAALLLPFGRWTATADGATSRQRFAAGLFAACGGLALAAMLGVTALYVLDLSRPPTATSHPETGWWWPYLGCYILLAAIAVALGRRLGPASARAVVLGFGRPEWLTAFAAFATGSLAAAALLGLRMAYAELDFSTEHWFAAIAAAGALGMAAALTWHAAAVRPFDRALAQGLAGLGAAFAVPALGLMLLRTGAYALDLDRAAGGDAIPRWWWSYVAVFLGLVAGGRWLGRRLNENLLAPAVAAGVLGAEALLLRAAYGNGWIELHLAYWLPVVATVGALTAAVAWWNAARSEDRFDRVLARWATGVGALVGGPALTAMVGLSTAHVVTLDEPSTVAAWGEAGWWWTFFGFYAVAAGLILAVGTRLARAGRLASPADRVLGTTATATLVLAAAEGWRVLYGLLPLERLDWLALAVPLGATVVATGLRLKARGLTLRGRVPDAFTALVGEHLTWVGGIVAVAAQAGATLLTLAFVVARDDTLPHADNPAWWWRYLVLHSLVAAGAWVWGKATGKAAAAPVAAGYALLALLLALRMATVDLVAWSIAGLIAAAGCYLLWTAVRNWERGTEFERALRSAVAVVGLGLGGVSLPANLLLGAAGEADATIEAVLYAALAVGVFAAGLRERLPLLSYGAAGSSVVAIAFAVAAAGVAPVNAGYANGALAWALLGGSLAIPASGLWAGQRPVWERAGYAVGLLPILLGLTQAGALDPGTTAYGRLTLAVASQAGLLLAGALTAPRGRRAIQGYGAATLGLGALLMQIAAAEPTNVQAYTVPVALYLLGLAWSRRRDPLVFDVLVACGAAVLMVPPFLQSFGSGGFGWALLCGAEGLLFVFAGLGIGRRVPVAAGVVAVTVVAIRQTLDYVNSLPTWAIMALVGFLLLLLGTLSLIARDTFLRRVEETRGRWSELR